METSSSEEDLQNVEDPGTSTSSATTHNSRKGKSESFSKQPTVKRIDNSHFSREKLSKHKLTCKNAVARIYGSWAPASNLSANLELLIKYAIYRGHNIQPRIPITGGRTLVESFIQQTAASNRHSLAL